MATIVLLDSPAGRVRQLVYAPEVVQEARRTFQPHTGNPENGNWSDWADHLQETEERLNEKSEKAPP